MTRDLATLATQPLSRDPLSPAQLAADVAVLGARWSVVGDDLQLALKGGKMELYGRVAAEASWHADQLDHHPDIALGYQRLTLAVHTHDAKAITALDVVLAARLEQWLRWHAA